MSARVGLAVLLLAFLPTVASAQTGRKFVSLEAYVGCARLVQIGKITEIEQIEYSGSLTKIQKVGKPYRLVFEVAETIRGKKVEKLELVLSLQGTHYLECMRDQSAEIMLVGGSNHLDRTPRTRVGIEEQGAPVPGDWYQFRLLEPVEVSGSGRDAKIAELVNSAYDECRMFTNRLKVVKGRDAILKRARAFAKRNHEVLQDVMLRVPNEFGELVGFPNAYCMISLPVCRGTEKTLLALKADPGRVMRRIKARHAGFDRESMLESVDKALAAIAAAKKTEAEPDEGS